MSKFRTSILIVGLLVIAVAASLLTVLGLYATGAVVTEKVELVYSVDDIEKEYDGSPLVAEDYRLVSGQLNGGHYAVVEIKGAQTDVGESKSGLGVKILDEKGYDVSGSYKIGVKGGSLKVTPKKVSVILNDSEVVYNGSVVNFENYSITEGELVSGHILSGSANARLISVNDSLPSDLKPVIFDASGREVTQNYEVNFTMGNIRVVPREISVKPVDKIKVYDGVEVSEIGIELISGTLADGQYFKEVEINDGAVRHLDVCDVTTRITKIAVYQRVGLTEIDVTENYEIDRSETGVLRIDKRPLTVAAKSGSWEYDGVKHTFALDSEPLYCQGLAKGEELLSVTQTGEQTDAGSSVNSIENIILSNGTGNYEITKVSGTLTVLKREVTLMTPTYSKTYDGAALLGATQGVDVSSVNLAAGHYIELPEGGVPSLTGIGSLRNKIDCVITDGVGDLTFNYKITYLYGEISIKTRDLKVTTPTLKKDYDGNALLGFTLPEDVKADNLADGQKLQMPAAAPSVVDVEKKENKFAVTVLGKEDIGGVLEDVDVTRNYNITYNYGTLEVTRRIITVKTPSETREYDGNELKREDAIIDGVPAGLTFERTEGQQYPALTNVGRALNSVKYELKSGGSAVDAKNYTVQYDYGTIEITPYVFRLKLKDYSKTYNDEEFALDSADALEENAFTELLPAEAFTLSINGDKIIDAGEYTYKATLKEGYTPSNYDITVTGGNISVAKCEVGVFLEDCEYDYDRQIHTPEVAETVTVKSVNGSDVTHIGDVTAIFKTVTNATVKNAGAYTYTVRCIDPDFLRNHNLHITEGDITVNQCVLNIDLPEDATVTYDGSSHLPKVEDLGFGHEWLQPSDLKIVSDGSGFINASEIPYTYTVEMANPREADNFDLNAGVGSVTISKADCTINLAETTYTYNGAAHRPDMATAIEADSIIPEVLAANLNKLELKTFGDMKNVGDYPYTASFRNVADENNYNLTVSDGKITIVPNAVTVKLKEYDMQYTGAVQTITLGEAVEKVESEGGVITADNLSRYFEITCAEQIKDVKTYSYNVKFVYREDSENFNLDVENAGGTYKVSPIKVKLATSDLMAREKVYDGKNYVLDCDGLIKSGNITLNPTAAMNPVVNYTFTTTCASVRSDVGSEDMAFSSPRVYGKDGEDITRNFEITNEEKLKLTINPKKVTFTLDNYICSSGNMPSGGSTEFLKCIGISITTPLLTGDTLSISDDVYINYNSSASTLTLYDFDGFAIYNSEGVDVTGNYEITNTEPLTSSVIVMS